MVHTIVPKYVCIQNGYTVGSEANVSLTMLAVVTSSSSASRGEMSAARPVTVPHVWASRGEDETLARRSGPGDF